MDHIAQALCLIPFGIRLKQQLDLDGRAADEEDKGQLHQDHFQP